MATRLGSLSASRYFPSSGDLLESTEDGLTLECVRANTYTDPKHGKIRYGLLLGWHPDFEDSPVVIPIMDVYGEDDKEWLDGVDIIHKRTGADKEGDPVFKEYHYDEDKERWLELRD